MSLVFVISPPRAGSTLLQRMMGAHSEIFTHPEPHLITPIAHLGVYNNVDKAPYDHINAAEATKAFIEGLPRGEQDYLDALRAYTDTLYGRMLSTSGRTYFLDKTPANYVPLTPLSFLDRTAAVFPSRLAVVHGRRRYTWAEAAERCRRLGSALSRRGIGKGDTVAAMLPNTPEAFEATWEAIAAAIAGGKSCSGKPAARVRKGASA